MLRRLRRVFQLGFFIFFVVLILLTEGRYNAPRDEFVVTHPVGILLQADPLVMLTTVFFSREVMSGFAWAVGLLLFTMVFGRFFCGWVCPQGAAIDFIENRFFRKGMIRKRPLAIEYRHIKYILLFLIVIVTLLHVHLVGYFDPLALITRFFITVVFPAVLAVVNILRLIIETGFNFLLDKNFLAGRVLPVKDFYNNAIFNFENNYFSLEMTSYSTSIIILVITFFVFAISIFGHRCWCKNLCPLGALLGLTAVFSPLRRGIREGCDECNVCLTHCHSAVKGASIRNYEVKECIRCFECANTCRKAKVFFGLFFPGPGRGSGFLPSRRQFMATLFGGTLFAGYMRSAKWTPKSKFLIRPPGASLEDVFSNKCIRCGQCMKVCPTKVIQPSFAEAGLEGFWTPRLDYRVGYCDDICTRCGQVCPTGAIKNLQKTERQFSKIGTAFFDKDKCLPWYKDENCIKCEEHCPVATKAIHYEDVKILLKDKKVKIVKRPYVNEEDCIGCGICEYQCPVKAGPGIVVTNYKERRY